MNVFHIHNKIRKDQRFVKEKEKEKERINDDDNDEQISL